MEHKNIDLWAIAGAFIALVVIFLSTANWIAGELNLDLRSASFVLVGVLLAIAISACVVYLDWSMRVCAPWIVVLVAPALFPALTYWASAGPGLFHLRAPEQDMAWYGEGWWQLLIFLVLAFAAYRCNKLTGDWFMD